MYHCKLHFIADGIERVVECSSPVLDDVRKIAWSFQPSGKVDWISIVIEDV